MSETPPSPQSVLLPTPAPGALFPKDSEGRKKPLEYAGQKAARLCPPLGTVGLSFLFEFLRLNIVLGARASTTSRQREAGLWAVTWDGSDGDRAGWWRGGKVASFLSCTRLH